MKKLFVFGICLFFFLTPSIYPTSTSKLNYSKNQENEQLKEWTLIFYCSGDDKEMFGDCEDCILNNETLLLLQNIYMKMPIFSKLKINIVVLIDGASVIHGYYSPSKLPFINKFNLIEEYNEDNFANYTKLRDFLIKCKNDFPAKRYLFYGFGHGGGWSGAFSDEYTNDPEKPYDLMEMQEIRYAIEASGGMDIIIFGNCIMGCIESAYELRNCTDVYIGSQEITIQPLLPLTSWYNCINVLKKNPYLSTYDTADEIIKNFKKIYRNPCPTIKENTILSSSRPKVFTMSAIKTKNINNLSLAIDKLSEIYIKNQSKYEPYFTNARAKTEDFPSQLLSSKHINGFLVDIYNFTDILSEEAQINNDYILYNASEEVKNCLKNTIISEWHQKNHPNANGLNLFLSEGNISENPGPLAKYDHKSYVNATLEFKDDHLWDEFLEIFLN